MGTKTSLVDCVHAKRRDLAPEWQVYYGFQALICGFVFAKQRL